MVHEPLLLDGKALSQRVQHEVRRAVEALRIERGSVPGLAVILVGEDPASKTYVASKERVAQGCGLHTVNIRLPEQATQQQVAEAIDRCNADPAVHGILLQLPLPRHLDADSLLRRIDPRKDADGLHPLNQGLALAGKGGLLPCTPQGCLHLIDLAFASPAQRADLNAPLPHADLSGLRAVVVGRSVLVGKPLSFLLLARNATVTMAHSKTPDLPALCAEADILVAAVGRPKMVGPEWVGQGAIVIDVGINRDSDGKLCGDVDFAAVVGKTRAITPVPGGVGPMTVAMLVRNTLEAYRHAGA